MDPNEVFDTWLQWAAMSQTAYINLAMKVEELDKKLYCEVEIASQIRTKVRAKDDFCDSLSKIIGFSLQLSH